MTKPNNTEESMRLVSSFWGEKESFSMIPNNLSCPFVEVLFNVDHKVLCIVGKTKKEKYHNIPKLDTNGAPQMNGNTQQAKMERVSQVSYSEYFIKDAAEIDQFILDFAINSESFDHKKYFKVEVEVPVKKSKSKMVVMP